MVDVDAVAVLIHPSLVGVDGDLLSLAIARARD
jgi:hypothetical protein